MVHRQRHLEWDSPKEFYRWNENKQTNRIAQLQSPYWFDWCNFPLICTTIALLFESSVTDRRCLALRNSHLLIRMDTVAGWTSTIYKTNSTGNLWRDGKSRVNMRRTRNHLPSIFDGTSHGCVCPEKLFKIFDFIAYKLRTKTDSNGVNLKLF